MTSTEPSLSPTPSISSTSLFSLTGKNALITGGTRGIGAAVALALAQAGCIICLVVRPQASSSSEAHPALRPLPTDQGQKHSTVVADLSDSKSVKEVFPKALELNEGKIDILINCAGIQRRNPSTEFKEDDWDEVSHCDILGA